MKYSILVNTCDNFEDCWFPFFKLFSFYWPNCNGQIYLNTEYKNYQHERLKINSLKVCDLHNIPKIKKAKWSQCLKWALENIEDEIILYLQEDYFLKDHVKNELVENYVQLMIDNTEIDCIHLTDQGAPTGASSIFKNLNYVPKVHPDRISCQAAIWRKDVLLQYIRIYETGWNFEMWGSKRAAIMNHNFFVVDSNYVQKDVHEIVPYLFTGIIGGKWINEVVPLFEKHQIAIDFNKRGFFSRKKLSIPDKIINKIRRMPMEIRCWWDLFLLKIKQA